MKRWYVQFTLLLAAGLVLFSMTFGLVRGLDGVSHSQILGWLDISGVGVGISIGAMLLLVAFITADVLWLLSLVFWIVRKKFHIKSKNNTLYLP